MLGRNSGISVSLSFMPVMRRTKPSAETCVGMVMMRMMKADAIFFSLKSYACTPYAVSAEK